MLVEDHKLDAIVKLPSGVFQPYAGVSTAILLFTKTNSGGTDHVWFYDVPGRRYVARRQAARRCCREEKLGPRAAVDAHAKMSTRRTTCRTCCSGGRSGTARAERARHGAELLRAQGRHRGGRYDLSINRYKEVTHEATEHRPPKEILAELQGVEEEIAQGLNELEAML